jgi:hypothetical protein
MSPVGGVIIFLGSVLFAAMVFPNYFAELIAVGGEVLKAEGKAEAEI